MIQSLKMNTTCPTCRTDLDERPDISLNDSYYDSDEEHDVEDEDEDDDISDISSSDYDERGEHREYGVEIELVVDEFVKHGYDLKDAMSLLLMRYSKTDPKYTKEYIDALEENFDQIYSTLLTEKRERRRMMAEDRNACL